VLRSSPSLSTLIKAEPQNETYDSSPDDASNALPYSSTPETHSNSSLLWAINAPEPASSSSIASAPVGGGRYKAYFGRVYFGQKSGAFNFLSF
jgi:hypothetical protein